MTNDIWIEIGHWAGIVFGSAFLLLFCVGSIILMADKTRRKHFYREPIGWHVKYWIGEEDHYGTVTDVRGDDGVVIESANGDVVKRCDEVNPLYKKK